MISVLLKEGADATIEDRWHGTAVQDALRYKHDEVAGLLGADTGVDAKSWFTLGGLTDDPSQQSESTPLLVQRNAVEVPDTLLLSSLAFPSATSQSQIKVLTPNVPNLHQ